MSDLKERLTKRAQTALANADEVTEELLDLACAESDEACAKREVPLYARLDIAFIRLKLYLKIEMTGEDELLLKNAMEVVKDSPFKDETSGTQSPAQYIQSKKRESEFC